MSFTKNSIVGEVVVQDYRTAAVFKTRKIDFCCNGNRSIEDVCEKQQIDPNVLIEELEQAVVERESLTPDFQTWDMDLLADYIEKKHHRYVTKKIPELTAYLHKVARVHGELHKELIEIEQLFLASAQELLAHMEKEEKILFPYVRKMAAESTPVQPPFGSVKNPIQMMKQEHDTEGDRFRKIAELSNNYLPPQEACNTYRVAFLLLKEFEEDLHLHIHLENNILFPKAIAAERSHFYA